MFFHRHTAGMCFFFHFVFVFFSDEVPLCTSLQINRWAFTDAYVAGRSCSLDWLIDPPHLTLPVKTNGSEGVFHYVYFWPGHGHKINEWYCTLFLIAGAYFAFILWKKTTLKQTVILSRINLSGRETACNRIRPYFTTSNQMVSANVFLCGAWSLSLTNSSGSRIFLCSLCPVFPFCQATVAQEWTKQRNKLVVFGVFFASRYYGSKLHLCLGTLLM